MPLLFKAVALQSIFEKAKGLKGFLESVQKTLKEDLNCIYEKSDAKV